MVFSKSEFKNLLDTDFADWTDFFSVFHGEFRDLRVIRVLHWLLSSDNEKAMEGFPSGK